MNIKNIVEEILKSSSTLGLEKQYDNVKKNLKKKDIVELSINDLRILLAFEYLKDGAEQDFVEEVWKSKDSTYKNKINLLKQLKIFGY